MNFIVVLVSAVIILLTSEPDLQIETRKAFRQLFTVVFTIALVDFTWNILVREKQEKQLKADRDRLIQDVHGELQKLYQIRDTAILAVDTQLSLSSRIDEYNRDIFIVKIYLPGAKSFFDALEPSVKRGEIKTINLVFLDNRPNTDGALLHRERAETMYPRRPEDSMLELRKSINATCNFARAMLKSPGLEEFCVYLCNQLPTVSITQLSDKRTYLAFFFYNVNSVNSPQLHVDLTKGEKSSLVSAYEGHKEQLLSRIRQQHAKAQDEVDPDKRIKYIFNLRKKEDIEELEGTQELSVLLNVPGAAPRSAQSDPESMSA